MFEKGATRRGSKCRYDLGTQPCQLTARTLDFLEAVENTESCSRLERHRAVRACLDTRDSS